MEDKFEPRVPPLWEEKDPAWQHIFNTPMARKLSKPLHHHHHHSAGRGHRRVSSLVTTAESAFKKERPEEFRATLSEGNLALGSSSSNDSDDPIGVEYKDEDNSKHDVHFA